MATGRTASLAADAQKVLPRTAAVNRSGVSSQAAGKKWMVPQGQSRTGTTAQPERPYRTRSHAAANTGMKQGNSNGGSRVGGSACDNQALVASVKMPIQDDGVIKEYIKEHDKCEYWSLDDEYDGESNVHVGVSGGRGGDDVETPVDVVEREYVDDWCVDNIVFDDSQTKVNKNDREKVVKGRSREVEEFEEVMNTTEVAKNSKRVRARP
ncbi:hypothetical protein NDU88_001271 [Pleurodeles waltl]|uniref:Uncharacterized protein n=1 Tax=Pleurodeles waltl TaxID=8319 RepID=A0AAV7U5X7_PLEWA|nr:hypothetical protein NDU88_001271 [Pleurodeles waltl]